VLFRAVTPAHGRGKPYLHTCSKQVYDDVAYAIEQIGARAFTGDDIRATIDAPSTQVMTALAFLRERGCVETVHGRRNSASERYVYEDALIEWHALREGSPGSAGCAQA